MPEKNLVIGMMAIGGKTHLTKLPSLSKIADVVETSEDIRCKQKIVWLTLMYSYVKLRVLEKFNLDKDIDFFSGWLNSLSLLKKMISSTAQSRCRAFRHDIRNNTKSLVACGSKGRTGVLRRMQDVTKRRRRNPVY